MTQVTLGSDDMVGEQCGAKVNGISIDHWQKLAGLLLDSRRLDSRVPVQLIDAVAKPKLVQKVR